MSHDDPNLSIRHIFHSFQQSGEELHPPVAHPGEPLIETPKPTPTQASAPNPFQTPDQVVQPPSIPTQPSTPPRRLNPTRTRRTSRLLTAHIRHFREPTESTTDPDVIRSTTEREINFQSVQPVTDLEDIQRLLDLLNQCSRRRFIVQALLGNPVEPIRIRFISFERPTNYFHTIWIVNSTTNPLPTPTTRLDEYVSFVHEIHLCQDFRATIYPLFTQHVNHLLEDDDVEELATTVTDSASRLQYRAESDQE